MIIDMASDDPRTAMSCALVSCRWVARARAPLFHAAVLERSDQITAFLAIVNSPLLDAGSILHFVRKLTLKERLDIPHSQMACPAPRLADLLRRFDSLHTLLLVHITWDPFIGMDPVVGEAVFDISCRVSGRSKSSGIPYAFMASLQAHTFFDTLNIWFTLHHFDAELEVRSSKYDLLIVRQS